MRVTDVPYPLVAAAVSCGLALIVRFARAGTAGGALAGAVCCFALCLERAPGAGILHSGLPVLAVLLLMTLGATRVGRARKRERHAGQSAAGRDSAQVLANLGVAALAVALPLRWAIIASVAALAECAADTLGSEVGVLVARGDVRLITGGHAPAGADGGITWQGSAAGAVGAVAVAATAMLALQMSLWAAFLCAACGSAGSLFDSLLGTTVERRGALGNNSVNFLSTAFAALLAMLGAFAFH